MNVATHTHTHTLARNKEKLCSVLRHVPSDTFLHRFFFPFFAVFFFLCFPRFCLFWVTLNLMENLLTTCRLVVWLGLLPLPSRQSHPPTILPFPGPKTPPLRSWLLRHVCKVFAFGLLWSGFMNLPMPCTLADSSKQLGINSWWLCVVGGWATRKWEIGKETGQKSEKSGGTDEWGMTAWCVSDWLIVPCNPICCRTLFESIHAGGLEITVIARIRRDIAKSETEAFFFFFSNRLTIFLNINSITITNLYLLKSTINLSCLTNLIDLNGCIEASDIE